jgi:hypothetical protein
MGEYMANLLAEGQYLQKGRLDLCACSLGCPTGERLGRISFACFDLRRYIGTYLDHYLPIVSKELLVAAFDSRLKGLQ